VFTCAGPSGVGPATCFSPFRGQMSRFTRKIGFASPVKYSELPNARSRDKYAICRVRSRRRRTYGPKTGGSQIPRPITVSDNDSESPKIPGGPRLSSVFRASFRFSRYLDKCFRTQTTMTATFVQIQTVVVEFLSRFPVGIPRLTIIVTDRIAQRNRSK